MAEAEEVTFNVTLVPFPILSRASVLFPAFLLYFVRQNALLLRCPEIMDRLAQCWAHTHQFLFAPRARNLQHVRIPARGKLHNT